MDEIENATEEQVAIFPDYLATFHKWMLDRGRKENTARAYVRQMAILFQEDGKSPRGLASEAYFTITKASFKNKKGNGQRSASVRGFIDFWRDHIDAGRPLDKAGDTKMYQLDAGRGGGMPRGRKVEEEDPQRSAEEMKLRELLDLPESTGWKVSVIRRVSGDLIVATSPDGRAHKTQKEVLDHLGRPSKKVPEGRTLAELLDNPALKVADEKKDGRRRKSGEKNKEGKKEKKEKKEKKTKGKEKEKNAGEDEEKPAIVQHPAPAEGQAASSASSSSDAEESGDILDTIFGQPEPGNKRSGKKRKRAKARNGDESDAASTASSSSSSSSSASNKAVKVSLSEDADQLGGQLSTGHVLTHAPLSKRQRLANEMLRRVRNTTQGHSRYVALALVAEKIVESGKRGGKCPWTQEEIDDVVRELMAKELQNAKDFAARGEVPQPPTPDPKCPPNMDDEINNGMHRPMHRWTDPTSGSSLKPKLASTRHRWRHRSIQFVDELPPVFQIADWRVAFGELWISQPGCEVYCDRCGEQFSQTKGKLTGRDQRSSFAQDAFICFNCQPDDGVPKY